MSVCAAASLFFVSEAQAQDGKATITAQDGSILSCDVINGTMMNCVPIAAAPAQAVPAQEPANAYPEPAPVVVVQTDAPNPEAAPVVVTTEPAPASEPIEYQPVVPPEDHVLGRVLTDIGFNFLYNLVATGVGVGLILDGATNNDSFGEVLGGVLFMEVGYLVNPALAVMTSHAIWGGEGSMGWTWGGTFLGWLAAVGVSSLFLSSGSDDDKNALYYVGATLTLLMPTVGAILGYELTNKSNREQKYRYHSSVIIYPTFELSPERKTIGVGLQF